ncbi:MAG TPA: orotidine-5'-phosphate decarboxylase [Acidimicrobiales bacterium]|nr:orotidine-5'-phosphate decarboxylase [Acidimicrobiales bacterium]
MRLDSAEAARRHLALALDVDDLVVALRLARRLHPWFSVAKVGLELFGAAGPEAVTALVAEGYLVFLDLKLHDIPTTVRRAARVIGALGATYTTVHTQGGLAMVAAAVEGMAEGAAGAGAPPPWVLGVTVLTSDVEAPPQALEARATLAAQAGCGGIVCAAGDLEITRHVVPALIKVVPGIRPSGVSADDQARTATPAVALSAGADLLVLGRAVTAAPDPEALSVAITEELIGASQRVAGDPLRRGR